MDSDILYESNGSIDSVNFLFNINHLYIKGLITFASMHFAVYDDDEP